MAKSALKTSIETSLTRGIEELGSAYLHVYGRKQRGTGQVWYQIQSELPALVRSLPDEVATQDDIKPVCDYLNAIPFEKINDRGFRQTLRDVIREARARVSAVLARAARAGEAGAVAVAGGTGPIPSARGGRGADKAGIDGAAKKADPAPKRPSAAGDGGSPKANDDAAAKDGSVESGKPIKMDEKLYKDFIMHSLASCFIYYGNLFEQAIARATATNASFAKGGLEENMGKFREGFTSGITALRYSLMDRYPLATIRASGSNRITIPRESLIEIMGEVAVKLKEFLPLEIADDVLKGEIVEPFIAANLPQFLEVPLQLNEEQKATYEGTAIREYAIENAVRVSFESSIKLRKGTLLPQEQEVFVPLITDHLSELTPTPMTEPAINGHFGEDAGREFLIDLAVNLNDTHHAGYAVRDSDNLREAVNKNILELIRRLTERHGAKSGPTQTTGEDDDATHIDAGSAGVVAIESGLPPELDADLRGYIAWASQHERPGKSLLLKIFAAAGVTLQRYGATLSRQQIEVLLALFDGLREVQEEREAKGGRYAIRIDAMVDIMVEALKPIKPKPETPGRQALDGLEQKIAALEERIDRLVIETKEIGSLREQAVALEAQDEGLGRELEAAKARMEAAEAEVTQASDALIGLKPGKDFAAALATTGAKNTAFEARKVEFEGIRARRDTLQDDWGRIDGQIDALAIKERELIEARAEYDRLITAIQHL